MKRKQRELIGWCIRHELSKGIHTFTMCECKRHGCRDGKCWECLLEILIENKDKGINFLVHTEKRTRGKR